MVSFDPYLNWLGIPLHEQPPSFYRLLGIVLFESNPEVIQQAADRQSMCVAAHQSGPQGQMCQQLLSEIAMARFCLLDPQQKAAYDGQLYEGLAQRGERVSAAPPPPASLAGPQQFIPPSPQFAPPFSPFGPQPAQLDPQAAAFGPQPAPFGPQAAQFGPQPGGGPFLPGSALQDPMPLPGPPPMPAPAPGVAATWGPSGMAMPPMQQPVMAMPPTMMPAPPGFAPAMPYPFAPAAMPAAMPFPTAFGAGPAASPTAPPTSPPAAPQRPIDELESLTSQPTSQRRILKKRKKGDPTREIVLGVVALAGVFLFIVYAVVKSQHHSPRGFDKAVEEFVESPRAKLAEEHKQKEKEIAEQRQKKAAASDGTTGPLQPLGAGLQQPKQRPPAAKAANAPLPAPHNVGPPARAMDSPGAGGPVKSAPQYNAHDTPRDLGGVNDPVMETAKPTP